MENRAIETLLDLLQDHLAVPENKTRQRIMLASKKRFFNEGFAKVTIGELCHGLHISKKTFYNFFRDKEDLVLAIIASNITLFMGRLSEIFQSDAPPDKRVEMYMDFVLNMVAQNISVAFMVDLQARMPEIWEGIDNFRKAHVKNVMVAFREGQEAGLYSRSVDADKFSRFILLIIGRVLDPRLLYENGLQLQDVASIIFQVMLKGLYIRPEDQGRET